MGFIQRLKEEGVSLRVMHAFMTFLVILVSGLLVYGTFHVIATYQTLSDATDSYISMEKDAYMMLQASDYLTECAQRFTLAGELEYAENYFREAFSSMRREQAVADISGKSSDAELIGKLREAMDESMVLMDREYYAMKLVAVAHGYEEYPEPLKEVELKLSESMLSRPNKLTMARNLVLGKAYYQQKERIRGTMLEVLNLLETRTHAVQNDSAEKLNHQMSAVRAAILCQAVSIVLMILLTTWLGVHPVLKAVDHINADSPLAVIGANEFRYLARTYNKMYAVYKKSVENLDFKASHDELTQVYNRAGYERLMSGIDLRTTAMLLFDLDNFKAINDTYGHEKGDEALRKVTEVVRRCFRAEDHLCRIGGDEFVVLMTRSDALNEDMIRAKVDHINALLSLPADGLPPMSVSVGAAHGASAHDAAHLFELADQALYQTKRNGRKGCTFYAA